MNLREPSGWARLLEITGADQDQRGLMENGEDGRERGFVQLF
jgi:hypothetical protein